MADLPQQHQQVVELLSHHMDGVASQQQQHELHALLLNSEALRKIAAQYLVNEFLLRQEQQASLAAQFFQGNEMLPQVDLDALTLDASLVGERQLTVRAEHPSQSPPVSRRKRFAAALATCATLAIVSALLWQNVLAPLGNKTGDQVAKVPALLSVEQQRAKELFSPQFAVLTRAVGVTWGIPQDAAAGKVAADSAVDSTKVASPSNQIAGTVQKVGATLGSERLQFSAGAIQLEFCSGATVVLEGPADFEILSPMRAICHRGKLRAHAPPQAHGFSIAVPGMDVVDLGTEFAIAVNDGLSEVHVLEGEVSLRPTSSSESLGKGSEEGGQHSLLDGESIQFDPAEGLRLADANLNSAASEDFISSQKIASLVQAERQTRLEMWNRHHRNLIDSPTTLVHYDFQRDEAWSRTLINRSPRQDPGLNGAIVGCRWSRGRWPESQSLDFKGTSDRVRLNISGEYESLTYMAWVRIDGLERTKNALVLTDEWQSGEPHWQLSENYELILGVSKGYHWENPHSTETVDEISERDPFRGPDYVSPRLLGREDLGRWVFLATVYDAEAAEVRHYFDGQLRSSHTIESPETLRFGATSIGNWTSGRQGWFPVRAFNGRIDELTILSRPLSDEEIRQTFEMASP